MCMGRTWSKEKVRVVGRCASDEMITANAIILPQSVTKLQGSVSACKQLLCLN
jgi:hypothetical protein